MDTNLSKVLPTIKSRLLACDISEFKIGITGCDVEKRYWDGYNEEGYTQVCEVATGSPKAVIEAEKDLIEWARNDETLNNKCKNIAAGGNGDIANADKVYIVAKSNNVINSCPQFIEELWDKELLPEKLLPNLKTVTLK